MRNMDLISYQNGLERGDQDDSYIYIHTARCPGYVVASFTGFDAVHDSNLVPTQGYSFGPLYERGMMWETGEGACV